jgi:hypothetical protein
MATYDPKCYELAEYFLEDLTPDQKQKIASNPAAAEELALNIQEAAEQYLERYR